MTGLVFESFLAFITGGLTEEVDEKVLRSAFIPFGDISEVQLPIDYQTEKHRGFAFIDYELPEDAQAAIDNMVKLVKQGACRLGFVLCSIFVQL